MYQDEWQRGLKDLKADTISKLKKRLSELEKEVFFFSFIVSSSCNVDGVGLCITMKVY